MARTVTLATLRTEWRQRGDFNRSAVFTDAVVDGYINRSYAKLYDLLVMKQEDYFLLETTLSTVADSDTVNLPADFYKLGGIDLQLSTDRYAPMRRFELKERNRWRSDIWTAYGPTFQYRIESSNPARLRLLPTPNGVNTLRLFYVPHATVLVADGDTIDTINDYDDLIIERALIYAEMREERPIQERLALINKLEQEIMMAADGRDSSEPEYLAEPNDDRWSNY